MKIGKVLSTLCLMALLTAICILAVPTAVSAVTDEGYTYSVSDGKATITEADPSISGHITLPSTLGGYPVVAVSRGALSECESLQSVTIPACITRIDIEAFFDCTGLSEIRVDENNQNYSSSDDGILFNKEKTVLMQAPCRISGDYAVPDGVTMIDHSAFYNCDDLVSVTLPDSVSYIGYSAFGNCRSLTSVNIPDGVKDISNAAFGNCENLTDITLPDSVTKISDYAFHGCIKLTDINIPDGVTSIGQSAFEECFSLKSITIPKNVSFIGYSAFLNCHSLTGIQVDPDNQHFSSDSAGVLFDKDKTTLMFVPAGLSGQYTIPDSVTTIYERALSGCSDLQGITIPEGITTIGNFMFSGNKSLTNVTLPHTITTIENSAFLYCSSLQSITLPNSVKTIGSEAFGYCDSLTYVIIPDGVTTIKDSAFLGCSSLVGVSISDSVTFLGEDAFRSCTNLQHIAYAGTQEQWEQLLRNSDYAEITDVENLHFETELYYQENGEERELFCPVCNDVIHKVENAPCSHTWDKGTVIKEANCTEDGTTQYVCTVCSETKTEETPKNNTHKPENAAQIEATTHKYTCVLCEKEITATHDFENACDPDCAVCGFTREAEHTFASLEDAEQTCTVCGYVQMPTADPDEKEPAGDTRGFPWEIVIATSVVVVCAVVLFLIIKKHKKAMK